VGDERLPRHEILRSRKSFRAAYDEGLAFHADHLVLIIRRSDSIERRVGFVASRKVGNAVRRNRARRLLREAYRRLRVEALTRTEHTHLVFIARRTLPDTSFHVAFSQAKRIMVAAGVLDEPSDGDARTLVSAG